jgi:Condensation domain
MSGIKERIASLSPEKRAQLEKRLLEQRKAAGAAKPIRARKEGDPSPLSFAQQRLWFLDQLTPGTATYNVAYALRIEGPLEVSALEQALHAIIGRHEVVRTKLVPIRGNPVPVVAKSWSSSLRLVDLRDLPEGAREAEAQRLVIEEAGKPFNFARDLMLRCVLVRLAEEEHVFLHVSHHIAWDLRSKVIFYQELGALYAAIRRGEAPALPELSIQYADYALWQRTLLEGEALEKLAAYWKQQLGGQPDTIELPIDKPRPPAQSLRGKKLALSLPAPLLEACRALARQSGATLFMTLFAAFDVFLYALTGAEDISVGSPVAGRNQVEVEALVGFFINTLVLRVRLAGSGGAAAPSFREIIGRARETLLSAIAHQEMPFDKLVELLRPPRDLGRMPLFQVNFRVQGAAAPPLELAGAKVTPLELLDTATSKFDLALELPATDGDRGYWEYSTDLFEEATIARFSAELTDLLAALVAAPDAPFAGLPATVALRARYATRPLG